MARRDPRRPTAEGPDPRESRPDPPTDVRISHDCYESLIEGASDAMVVADVDQRIQRWNRAASETFGYSHDQILGRPLSTLLPNGARRAHDAMVRAFTDGDRDSPVMARGVEWTALRRNGEEFPAEIAVSTMQVAGETMLMAAVRDLTRRRQIESTLATRNAELDSLLTAIPDSVFKMTADGTIVDVAPGAIGLPLPAHIVGQKLSDVLPEALAARCQAANRTVLDTDSVVTVDFAETDLGVQGDRSFESRHARLGADEVIAVIRDVTDQRRAEAQLAHQVTHDTLTGLANRLLLADRLDQALRRSERNGGLVAVFMLDLDHFKNVNDSLGHDAGDRFLVSVARRLTGAVRRSDTVARLGGDEFIVLAEGFTDMTGVFTLAESIDHALRTPVQFGRRQTHISASLGIAVARNGDSDAMAMIRNADTAMYHAKEQGRGRIEVFDETLQAAFDQRLETEASLRQALEQDEFELRYQPIVRIATGTITGFEALLRWSHPVHGVVGPGEFLQIAEDAGLILPIGAWALRQACTQAAEWRQRFGIQVKMGVNISARQLVDPRFSELVATTLTETGLDPRVLSIEVTETALIDRREIAISNLKAVRQLGVQVALDDYGTGYASLTYLRNLPISHIKIDRSFIAGLTSGRHDAAIVESTIALAHALGRSVIAEGVEDADQLELLAQFRCDEAQGYHLGHPCRAAEIDASDLDRLLARPGDPTGPATT